MPSAGSTGEPYDERRRELVLLGTTLILCFIILRTINDYGDPVPWTTQFGGDKNDPVVSCVEEVSAVAAVSVDDAGPRNPVSRVRRARHARPPRSRTHHVWPGALLLLPAAVGGGALPRGSPPHGWRANRPHTSSAISDSRVRFRRPTALALAFRWCISCGCSGWSSSTRSAGGSPT